MTSDQRNQFEEEWPSLALRLQNMLRRKGLSSWAAEDLVQETGCRLIRMWTDIDRTKPLWPLATTIALNLLRDEMRKGSWSELTSAVPDAPSVEDVEARGLARVELRRVGGALSHLNESQRGVLLDEVTKTPSATADPSAMRMLRMRARKRLQSLMDQASVLGVGVGIQLRRVVRETELFITKTLPLDAERVPAAALSIVAALSLTLVDAGGVLHGGSGATGSGGSATWEALGTATADEGSAVAISSPGGLAGNGAVSSETGSRVSDRRGAEDRRDRKDPSDDDGGLSNGTRYKVPITDDTYIEGYTEIELEGFDEQGRDVPPGSGTGSLSCSTSPSGGAGASCTHGGDGWSQRSARVKQETEVWVRGERVL